MSEINSKYIKSELLKIARILESNYKRLLPKKLTDEDKVELTKDMKEEGMSDKEIAEELTNSTVRNVQLRDFLDNKVPVDWDLKSSIVNGKKVNSLRDLDGEDWVTTKDGKDVLKNLSIEGKLKDTAVEIMLEIVWAKDKSTTNKYTLNKKNEAGDWSFHRKPENLNLLQKEIEKLNKSELGEGDDFEVKSLYKKIFDHKRPQIKEFITNALDHNWKLSPRAAGGYILEFTVPGVDGEKNKQIVDEVKDKHIADKLVEFIFSIAEEEGFNKKHFSIVPSFKKKEGFSLLLKHT